MNYYLKCLKQFADFSGRARRSEYWFFVLFNMIFLAVAALLDNVADTTISPMFYGLFYILYSLAVFIPSLAAQVRRLHDVGKSGWFLLISFIPIIGAIWLLVLFCTDSQEGDNAWGANPKAVE